MSPFGKQTQACLVGWDSANRLDLEGIMRLSHPWPWFYCAFTESGPPETRLGHCYSI